MMQTPTLKPLHILEIKPFWSQMDALGHLNNAVYFTYCEQTRIAWFEAIGMVDFLGGKSEHGPVVINAYCTFLKSAKYPCNLSVTMFVGEIGNSSFMAHYEIRDQQHLYATGYSKIVWVDYQKEKSVPLPSSLKELLI